jgi:serine/threonine-protein kinase
MPLGRARWIAASPYLDRALDLAPAERTAWLTALRGENPALAGDVEALLDRHARLSDARFLEDEGLLEAVREEARDEAQDAPGTIVGAYRLLSPIGQGGMGTVWLAERCDGRFEGRAAVKLLNAALAGRAGEARFRREGSILARLTHPHIAHLVDAGVSPAGQPFLVLEHVDGERLDEYCDRRSLTLEARLRLMVDVIAAVTYAHANLIVHRDLKPSNVLVTRDGHVKLLDFGIAKLIEPDASDDADADADSRADAHARTALTREGASVLTPQYAAPEQVTGGDITIATDVYALGVLLYMLLSGQHPAGDPARPPADLLRAIVDSEPRRPSDIVVDATTQSQARTLPQAQTRTQTRTQANETLTTCAAARASTPTALRKQLQGDLDTIVAKALKKRPDERYASAAALADDIERHLSHRPIAARPDSRTYRAGRFIRRHRVPVALAALFAIALIAGVAGTITQARRAREQAARADRAAKVASAQRDFALRQLSRAEAIKDLNAFVLSDAGPSGAPLTVGALLARAERIVDRQQGETVENRVEMLMSIGRQYFVQTEVESAVRVLTRAYDLASGLPDRSVRARAGCELGAALARSGEQAKATEVMRGIDADLPDEPQLALYRVICMLRQSEVARDRGEPLAAVERVLAARTLNQSTVKSLVLESDIAGHLGESYRIAGRMREAEAAFRDATAGLTVLGLDETESAGTQYNNRGLVLEVLGRPLEAEQSLRRAIHIGSTDGSGYGVRPILLNNLARLLRELNHLDEARDFVERAYTRARAAADELAVSQSLLNRAGLYRERGDLARAAASIDELAPRLARMLPPGHVAFAQLAVEQGLQAQARGDLREAAALMDRAVTIAEASAQSLQYLPSNLVRRADLRLALDQQDAARADVERAIELERRRLGDTPEAANAGAGAAAVTPVTADHASSRLGRAYLLLGRVLGAQGHSAEAAAAFDAAIAHLTPSVGADHPHTRLARQLATAARS